MHTLVVTVCGEMEDGVEEVDIAGSALDYKCTHCYVHDFKYRLLAMLIRPISITSVCTTSLITITQDAI